MKISKSCVLLLASAFGCTDDAFLDTNDVLIALAEPGVLFVTNAPGTGDCVESGGAKVRIIGHHSDGTPGKEAKVQLWLTGPAAATLSLDAVQLSPEGTNEDACLLPTDVAGTTTLHARSGPIEVTAMVETTRRVVPTGGGLVIAAAPISSASATPASNCGATLVGACFPGTGRTANLVVQGLPTETKPVPEGSQVTLTTNFGLLGLSNCPMGPTSIANLVLVGGAANAQLCVPDLGGKATLTAQSGLVRSTLEIELRTIPRSVLLVPNRTQATAGATVSFTAFVGDCEGRGVADVALVFRARNGVFTPDEGTPAVPKTGADGSVTVSGTATTVPLEVSAEILGAPQVECRSDIGALP